MLSEDRVEHFMLRRLATELKLDLTASQIEQLAIHCSLLLRWNRRMNLTSLHSLEQIIPRHFGESLYLAKVLKSPRPDALMVDVGSGAGFPGLPLKVAWPSVRCMLLEPNQKKATFLKEVVRSCGLENATVLPERVESFSKSEMPGAASLVTMRAVAPTKTVIEKLRNLVAEDGGAALFVGRRDAETIASWDVFQWQAPTQLPGTEGRFIVIGHVPRGTC